MNDSKNYTVLAVVAAFLATLAVGCNDPVPVGYVGMRQESSGLDGKVLGPGRHQCWGWCQMKLVETADVVSTEKLAPMCLDGMNLTVDYKVRAQLKTSDAKGIASLLDRTGSKMKEGKLDADVLYKNYVQPMVQSAVITEVGAYPTTSVQPKLREIEAKVMESVRHRLSTTPMELIEFAIVNIDFPDVVTKAVELTKQRQIEIEQERAEQEKRVLQAENQLKIAEVNKQVKVAQAEADAAAIRILGSALTEPYLRLKQMENRALLYERVGAGDKVIFEQLDGGGSGGQSRAYPVVVPMGK